jgi:hypothetical protein
MHNTQLCFIINDTFCSLVHKVENEFNYLFGFYFKNKNETLIKEQILQKLNEHRVFELKYDDVTIAWAGINSTLIPFAVFERNILKDIYLTCFNESKMNHEIDYNRISNCSIVNIYDIPLWLKSFFILRFPHFNLQHQITTSIKGLLEQNAYVLKIHTSVFPDILNIIIVEKNEILFCNTFQITHENDIIYYLSFTLQQENLLGKKGNITFSIHPLIEFTTQDSLNVILSKLPIFKDFIFLFDPINSFKLQQFCV